ncbi:MAG TPA: DUF6221 family protein [Aeromicrobium sp.]|nr:DUF6221 family protein [Aeromicrobium sp.]HKY58323.1 DUF6221 family protein [Aeromicrobium sp.]
MTTLSEFLLARIAEDEVRARSSYRVIDARLEVADYGDHLSMDGERMSPREYVDRFCEPNPDVRLLAECKAKRRIVELHALWDNAEGYSPSYWSAPVEEILAQLALPYADHPDFDEAWRLQ